jgi:nucleotide-binding universal stress UspA family protein
VHVRTSVSLKETTAASWDELYARRCAGLLAEFRGHLPPTPGVTVETRFLRGEAASTVAAFAAASGAGLIVCGRKYQAAPDPSRANDVSARMMSLAACPVLVVSEHRADAAMH